jgi:co-chaperonin GroES (HSP10)
MNGVANLQGKSRRVKQLPRVCPRLAPWAFFQAPSAGGHGKMIKPLRDKIFVKPIQRIQSDLWIQTAEAPTVGHITALGDDAADQGLSVGDKIYFGTLAKDYKNEYLKYQELKDENLIVMSWQDVCFVEEME